MRKGVIFGIACLVIILIGSFIAGSSRAEVAAQPMSAAAVGSQG